MTGPAKQEVSFSNSKASVLLDLVRGIAAILVLVSHWKVTFFVDYLQIPHYRRWFALPYFLSDAGHQAVLIFFVLSGYLISSSVFRSAARGTFSWRSYLTHRFVRLWVVLIPGLLLGGLWDWIGLHYGHTPNLYNGVSAKAHFLDVSQNLTSRSFFGNIAFLQTLLVPSFGSNGSLWSLANEFWYYILFPLGWLALRRGTTLPKRILYVALLLPLMWFLRSSVLPLFPIWLAGTALALLPRLRVGGAVRLAAAIIYAPLVFVFAELHSRHGRREEFAFGAITFLFFWIMLSATQAAGASRPNRVARQMARFSYTLYVVHMPALLLLTTFIAGEQLWSPADVRHDAVALAVLLFLVAYAWLIAAVTEFRTDRVRHWVERRLAFSRSKSPSNDRMMVG